LFPKQKNRSSRKYSSRKNNNSTTTQINLTKKKKTKLKNTSKMTKQIPSGTKTCLKRKEKV
jgi:hypothetical protein